MAQIIQFVANKELSRIQNLTGFIDLCKNRLTLWSDVPGWNWSNISWPTLDKSRAIGFMDWKNRSLSSPSKITADMAITQPMQDIAKAYIRYRHTQSPHKNTTREVIAFRVIDVALKLDGKDGEITKFNEKHLNHCFELLSVYKARAIYAAVLIGVLKKLGNLSIITPKASFWVHPYVGKLSYGVNNGAQAASEVKASKLPDQNALLALAEIFAKGYEEGVLDEIDVMVTSIIALMLCTPMRVAEILRLRVDCLKTDKDKNGNPQYYLNYWVPKIGAYDKKAIPITMAPVAIEAIRRLLMITDGARKLALYYETSPTLFFRHEHCPDVGEYDHINAEQRATAMGYNRSDICTFLLKKHLGSGAPKGLTLNKIWNEVVIPQHRKLNPYFPYQEDARTSPNTPPKMSECLLCFHNSQFAPDKTTSPVLLRKFVITQLTSRLGWVEGVIANNRRTKSIFIKHGYDSIRIKSHSLRHFLNHLAFHAGVGVELITEWSSRASVNQTFTYIDDAHYLQTKARAREIVSAAPVREYLPPIYEDTVESLDGPFQRTLYGLCLRSWKAGPCNKTFDCLNCSEVLMCKGDRLALETVKKERENLQVTYDSAQKALETGERATTRWLKLTGPYLKKLTELEVILTNPEIPDGSPIQVTGCNDFSPEQAILQDKIKESGLTVFDKSSIKKLYSPQVIKGLKQLNHQEGDQKRG